MLVHAVLALQVSVADPAILVAPLTAPGTVEGIAVNDAGSTAVRSSTSGPFVATLWVNGLPKVSTGNAVQPPGKVVFNMDPLLGIDELGRFVAGYSLGPLDGGLYRDGQVLYVFGDTPTATGFPAGDTFGFLPPFAHCGGEWALVNGTTSSGLDYVLRLDGAGNQELIHLQGDPVPGFPDKTISGNSFLVPRIASDGGTMVRLFAVPGSSADGWMLAMDDEIVARAGEPIGTGLAWENFRDYDLNASDDWIARSPSDNTPPALGFLGRGTEVFRVEGQSVFGQGTVAPIQSFPSFVQLLSIADRAVPDADPDVLWTAEYDPAGRESSSQGLFLDEKLLLRTGAPLLGALVNELDGATMSPSGRYIVVDVGLRAYRLDLGRWESIGQGGVGVDAPKLHGFGQVMPFLPVTFHASRVPPGSVGNLVVGFEELGIPFLGATLVPTPDIVRKGIPISPGGFAELRVDAWPTGLTGVELFAQFWAFDAASPTGVVATNGIRATSL